ncbi:MAG TPA: DUF697 domain-containing protein [Saprospiraceae bacterium]|nr:DUF697 domain-containing protein [Saprospiraceae bacterium]
MENKSQQADQIIKNHMIWSMGAGMIWVPVVDFLAVSAIQLDMVRQLSNVYGHDFKESQGKAIISALTTTGVARIAARAVKFIPGVGTLLGGITMSALSGASTFAIGELFKKHFETGGTMLDFDVNAFKAQYDELFEKGKDLAQKMKASSSSSQPSEQNNSNQHQANSQSTDESKPNSSSGPRSSIDQLKDIAELKEKGLLTEEEYSQFKAKILKEY